MSVGRSKLLSRNKISVWLTINHWPHDICVRAQERRMQYIMVTLQWKKIHFYKPFNTLKSFHVYFIWRSINSEKSLGVYWLFLATLLNSSWLDGTWRCTFHVSARISGLQITKTRDENGIYGNRKLKPSSKRMGDKFNHWP